MKSIFQYLGVVATFLAFTNINATSYTINFVNNTPYDIKFYELTIPANQATPQNFLNYITPGTTKKEVKDGNSYKFTTNTNTDSIYMIVTQLAQSLVNPVQFNVNSTNAGTLTISSTIQAPFRIIMIKKGSTIITSERYLF